MKKITIVLSSMLLAGLAIYFNSNSSAITGAGKIQTQSQQQQSVQEITGTQPVAQPHHVFVKAVATQPVATQHGDSVQIEKLREVFEQTEKHINGTSLHVTLNRHSGVQVRTAEDARALIKQAAASFLKLRAEDDIVVKKSANDNLGNEFYTFQQTYKDVPLHNTLMVARIDAEQNLRLVSGRFESDIQVDTTPLVEGVPAVSAALETLAQPPANEPSFLAEPSLQIHFNDQTAQAALVYRSIVEYYDTAANMHLDEVLVDAHDGRMLAQYSRIYAAGDYYSGNSRYAYINGKAKSKTRARARSSRKITTPPSFNAVSFRLPPAPQPLRLAPVFLLPPPQPIVRVPLLPPPPQLPPPNFSPIVFAPQLPRPYFPPIVTRPQLPPPYFPPIVTGPQLPPPYFPPIVSAPQLPPPNFPPIVSAPQLPPPNFPPVVTAPQLPPPNFPPIVNAPQLPPPNFPPVVTAPQLPSPNYPPVVTGPTVPVSTTPPPTTTTNNSLTRELYQLRAGQNCVGQQGVPINSILPGQFLFGESGPSSNANAMAQGAYDNLGTTYWYFRNMHGRKSWDDKDRTLTASVGAQFASPQGGCSPYNAQYMPQNGQIKDTSLMSLQQQAMYLPDKDQLIFGGDSNNPFTQSLDLVAHEYTHGVTMHSSQIGSNAEGASMNEAYSDVFAAGVEAWSRSGGSAQGNPPNGFSTAVVNSANTWELCEACGPNFPPRYLADPARGKTSMHQSVYYYGQVKWPTQAGDFGNTHGNGGIFTMAFYLLTQGGVHPEAGSNGVPNVPVTGIGMEKALKVFYYADAYTLGPKSKYADARKLIADAATALWESENQGSSTCNSYYVSVNQAFEAVGVKDSSYSCK